MSKFIESPNSFILIISSLSMLGPLIIPFPLWMSIATWLYPSSFSASRFTPSLSYSKNQAVFLVCDVFVNEPPSVRSEFLQANKQINDKNSRVCLIVCSFPYNIFLQNYHTHKYDYELWCYSYIVILFLICIKTSVIPFFILEVLSVIGMQMWNRVPKNCAPILCLYVLRQYVWLTIILSRNL